VNPLEGIIKCTTRGVVGDEGVNTPKGVDKTLTEAVELAICSWRHDGGD